jgi:hypothetical protein
MTAVLTDFPRSAAKLAILAPCMNLDEDADGSAEWTNNIISRAAVVYDSGRIARASDTVRHTVDPDELTLCRRLAREAFEIMERSEVGMGSESSAHFSEFFVAANVDGQRLDRIDESVVRRAFGGTIFPPATITVEPLAQSGVWWGEVLLDGEGQDDTYFAPWRALIKWFRGQQSFVDSAFVRIGDTLALAALHESDYPDGTDTPGCVLPRLALGLTRAGSLAGLFGYVVQT